MARQQHIPLRFSPANGLILPEVIFSHEYRQRHGENAWLFNPWTGRQRNAQEVKHDVLGVLIEPEPVTLDNTHQHP